MVKERLELDLRAALADLNRLDDVLRRAAVDFSQALAKAVSQSHTIKVSGDAKDVTRAIDRAVEAADTGVAITAEASGLTRSINSAVEAADTTIAPKVDTAGLREAATASAAVGTNLGASDVAAGGLFAKSAGISKVLGSLGIALGAGQILGFFNDSVQAASNLNETINATDVVFEKSAKTILDWSKTSSASVLLSRTAALQAASGFGALFNQAVGVGDASADMSIKTVQLAADLASVYNVPVDDALERLKSGLIGEAEPLRRLNVLINEQAVATKAMELGLVDANGEVTEGGKIQARFALILEQTKKQQGDVARTADGLANTQRRVSAEFEDAQTKIGRGLLPAMKELFGAISRDVLPALTRLGIAVGPPLAQVLTIAAPLITGMAEAFGFLAEVLGPVLDFLSPVLPVLLLLINPITQLAGIVKGLGAVWGEVWPTIKSVLEGVYDAIKGPVLDPLVAVLDTLWGIVQDIAGIAAGAFSGLVSSFETLWEVVSLPIKLLIASLKELKELLNDINPFGTDFSVSRGKGGQPVIESHAHGGVVGEGTGRPLGAPQMILAHVGERVLRVGEGAAGSMGPLRIDLVVSGSGGTNPETLSAVERGARSGVSIVLRDIVSAGRTG